MTQQELGRVYLRIWFLLIALIILELIIAFLPASKGVIGILLTIIVLIKSTLIMGYFMHLRFEKTSFVYSLLIPVLLFMIMLIVGLIPDGGVTLGLRLGE
jgi:cytochrome c oxidase subunit IV